MGMFPRSEDNDKRNKGNGLGNRSFNQDRLKVMGVRLQRAVSLRVKRISRGYWYARKEQEILNKIAVSLF